MIKSSYKIATVWGIPIRANISLFVILIAFAVNMAQVGGPLAIPFGLLLGVMLFTSIALHELGHSYVAIKKGCKVRSITLAIFGGVANMESIPSKPRDEFQMAIAGPLVSITLAATCHTVSILLFKTRISALQMLGSAIGLIAFLNLVLAIFNIIPAFPMDGGRVFRALLTPKMGKLKATYIASRIGKALAMIFGFWGLSQFFFEADKWGMLKVIVAIFIYTGAENEYNMVKMQDAAQWFSFGEDAPDDENKVEISPPPYDDGPASHSDIQNTDEDNPFTNRFRS